MYTFNRNKETTSLSQFMATGQRILEEEDQDSECLDAGAMKCEVRKSIESDAGMDVGGQSMSKLHEEENFMFDMEEKKGEVTSTHSHMMCFFFY